MAEITLNPQIIGTDTVIYHDTGEEYSLPDYVPEVRRVLCTLAQPLPESRYISEGQEGDKIDFAGSITYSLIYISEDGELCAVPLNSNYEGRGQISKSSKAVIIDTEVDNVTCRVIAPRRVSLKARLKSRLLGFCEPDIKENITPKSSKEEIYLERQVKEYEGLKILQGSLEGVKISERLEKGGKPLWCDAQGIVKEISVRQGAVKVKGDVYVKCLISRGGKIESSEKIIPIYEEIEVSECSEGDIVSANIRCVSLSISNEEANNEESLFFDLECEIECECYKRVEAKITKDAYSTNYEMENEYKKQRLNSIVKACQSSISISEGIKRKNQECEEIIQIIPNPVVEKTEVKGSRLFVSGKVLASIIGSKSKENGEREYLSESYEIPFKFDMDLGKTPKGVSVRAIPKCVSLGGRYEREMIHLNGEISLLLSVYEEYEADMLKCGRILKDKEIKRDDSSVKVYFPSDKDTLWEIAKMYHTRVNKICEENGIDKENYSLDSSIIID